MSKINGEIITGYNLSTKERNKPMVVTHIFKVLPPTPNGKPKYRFKGHDAELPDKGMSVFTTEAKALEASKALKIKIEDSVPQKKAAKKAPVTKKAPAKKAPVKRAPAKKKVTPVKDDESDEEPESEEKSESKESSESSESSESEESEEKKPAKKRGAEKTRSNNRH